MCLQKLKLQFDYNEIIKSSPYVTKKTSLLLTLFSRGSGHWSFVFHVAVAKNRYNNYSLFPIFYQKN